MYKIDKLPAIQYLAKNDTILVLLYDTLLNVHVTICYLLCEYRLLSRDGSSKTTGLGTWPLLLQSLTCN